MFVVLLNYKKPMSEVDRFLVEHRAFLDEGYKKDYFIASGPRTPRTGGIVLSQLTERETLEKILQQDPFHLHGIADYDIIEFTAVKHHPMFASFLPKT